MPYGTPPRQLERGRSNRFLAALPPHDFALLTPHLRTVTLERGTILHDAGDEIERVYFPHSGMVSVVAVMQSGAAVETATIGRAGVIGASTGLGVKYGSARVIAQLPGAAAWLSASQFHAAANGNPASPRAPYSFLSSSSGWTCCCWCTAGCFARALLGASPHPTRLYLVWIIII
jgi:Cyclic nucleotide-binding domain